MGKQQAAVKSVKDETTETTETAAPAETKKRTMLTPAQRVAKLEADLAEAKAKAEAKGKVQIDALLVKRATVIEQINERKAKVEAFEASLKELGHVFDDHAEG